MFYILLMYFGMNNGYNYLFCIGLGILIYGIFILWFMTLLFIKDLNGLKILNGDIYKLRKGHKILS